MSVSAMVSSESRVTVNTPGQKEGYLLIPNWIILFFCRLCDDTTDLGYTEYRCEEERKILWVDMATLQITCGTVNNALTFHPWVLFAFTIIIG